MTDDELRDVFAELGRIGADLGTPPGLAIGCGFRGGHAPGVPRSQAAVAHA